MERTFATASILHADLDAFYASVEQLRDPSLVGRPVVVGGGVVLAASYEARRFGVHSGMGGRQARALCPDAVVVSPRMADYGRKSREVMAVFDEFTPLVEPLSPDEAFLDVSGARRLLGPPAEIAARVRAQVRARTGLAVTVGVARTKFLAKVASGVAKPDGLLVVDPAAELDFLHPLPLRRLWGAGPVTCRRLAELGIRTVGDLARLPPATLERTIGRSLGSHLHALGWNHDPRAVEVGRHNRSIGSQQALGRRVHSIDAIRRVLLRLADRVGGRMRTEDRHGRTITLRVRFGDFRAVTRSRTRKNPTQATAVLYDTAVQLADRLLLAYDDPSADHPRSVLSTGGVTLVGISVSNLERPAAVQLELPIDRPAGHDDLEMVIDSVRSKFGRDAVLPAALAREPAPLAPSWTELDDS